MLNTQTECNVKLSSVLLRQIQNSSTSKRSLQVILMKLTNVAAETNAS